MKPTVTVALGVAIFLSAVAPAAACTRARPPALLALDGEWRAALADGFSAAGGVFLVEVRSAGPLDDGPGRMACDTYAAPPPPPARRASQAELRAYADDVRRTTDAAVACAPEKASIRVLETLKGPVIDGWIEAFAYIDVIDGPPMEPVPTPAWPDSAHPAYGAAVESRSGLMCDGVVFARRLSVQTTYLVFAHEGLGGQPLSITRALWADPQAPFFAEARRLAADR